MTVILDAAAVRGALTPLAAIAAITNALRIGLLPELQPLRHTHPVDAGNLLLMPGSADGFVGVKILGLAPGNPARGLPYITGSFLLLDGMTLAPVAVIDGAELTAIRTPAVSFAGILDALRARPGTLDVVIFGAGAQGRGHEAMLADVCETVGRPLGSVTIATSAAAPEPALLAGAGLVICATTARRPLFHEGAVGPDAVIVALGGHEPDVLEIDPALLRSAQVVVEDRATAIREAGEVIAAITKKFITADSLVDLADVASGRAPTASSGRVVFITTGLAWEDVVIAREIAKTLGVLS